MQPTHTVKTMYSALEKCHVISASAKKDSVILKKPVRERVPRNVNVVLGFSCRLLLHLNTSTVANDSHILPLSGLQVYTGLWKERPVVIKCGIEDPVKGDGVPDSVLQQEMNLFDKPTRGTSMDEFKEMLHTFLKVVYTSSIVERLC